MLAKLSTYAVVGLEGAIVEVEADIAQGLQAFTIVGLPDAAVQASKQRVRSAIRNAAALFRTGARTDVADSILDEGVIRVLAEAADLVEIEP